MPVVKLSIIEGIYLIEPTIFRDDRGYFFEPFNLERIQKIVGEFNISQANQSKSKKGVIRGLHFQKPPFTQSKLVQVIKGKVLDVLVDIRTDSPTFGQHYETILDGTQKYQLFIPKGIAHGFITLSKDAIFQYYVDKPYAPHYESGIRFDDKRLNIDWIMKRNLIVGDKDKVLKTFDENYAEGNFCTKAEFNYKPIQIQYKDENIK
jgi:dTDP-4-dehydrorhamnose 3,5-epimerase